MEREVVTLSSDNAGTAIGSAAIAKCAAQTKIGRVESKPPVALVRRIRVAHVVLWPIVIDSTV